MNDSSGQTSLLYLAETNEDLARRLVLAGQLDQAEDLLKQAVDIKERACGKDDPVVAEVLAALGRLYVRKRNFEAAEENLKRARELFEKAYYPDHASLGPVTESLADLYVEQGRLEDAEPLLKKVLEIHQKTSRGDRLDILHATRKLINLYQKLARWGDAEALLKKALQSANTPWGPLEDFLYEQAVTADGAGKKTEAEEAYKKAVAFYRQRGRHEELAKCMSAYAAFLQKEGRSAEAEELEKKALLAKR